MYTLTITNIKPVIKTFDSIIDLEAFTIKNQYKSGSAILMFNEKEVVNGYLHNIHDYAAKELNNYFKNK